MTEAITALVTEKRATGYKYDAEERVLARWLARRGVPAYVLPAGTLPRPARYVQHIYTDQELAGLFAQTDRCHYDSQGPFRHLVMPVLFRTIYARGLGASEARLLRFGDVDLVAGVLTIRDGKSGKDRQVPVSAPLRDRLAGYHARVAGRSGGDWFFPGTSGQPLTLANIDKNFRRFLWQARIPHGGRGHGPRAHDLRHSFAVNNLRSWFARGEDAGALLPVLQTHQGHSSTAGTDYCLRLTAESYPHITARIQRAYGDVVPPVTAGPGDGDCLRGLPAPLPHLAPGRAARLLTQHGRVLPRHLQAADRLLPRRQIHPARQAHPRPHRRRRDHRVPELAGGRKAQQHLDPQPAPGSDQLVLPVAAVPGPCQDGRLPGHSRRPRQEAGPAGREPPHCRADPPSARPARPVHPAGPP